MALAGRTVGERGQGAERRRRAGILGRDRLRLLEERLGFRPGPGLGRQSPRAQEPLEMRARTQRLGAAE